MLKIKKLFKTTVITLALSLGFATNGTAQVKDGERAVLPFLKKGYRPQVGIAPISGIQKN